MKIFKLSNISSCLSLEISVGGKAKPLTLALIKVILID